MKILIDTNIILDIALERQPFAGISTALLKSAHERNFHLFVTATTISDIYYITRKAKGKNIALNFIKDMMRVIDVASVDKQVILDALVSEISDFEDAIQESSARQQQIDVIVTRNTNDFKQSQMPIYDPETFLNTIASS